jgi:hypothetical protein
MAKHYGGISDGSDGSGRAAFTALMTGGRSGFNAVLGGNRSPDGKYERSEAHEELGHPSRQLRRLLHPLRHLRFVKIVLLNVDVAHVLVFAGNGRRRFQ